MPYAAPVHRPLGYRKPVETRRLSSAAYSHKWRKCRAAFLTENPTCLFCRDAGLDVLATEVDHIKSAADFPELFFEYTNLRSLCKPCHSRRTANEQAFIR